MSTPIPLDCVTLEHLKIVHFLHEPRKVAAAVFIPQIVENI